MFFKLFSKDKKAVDLFLSRVNCSMNAQCFFSYELPDDTLCNYENKIYLSKRGSNLDQVMVVIYKIPSRVDNKSERWAIGSFLESEDLVFTESSSIELDLEDGLVYEVSYLIDGKSVREIMDKNLDSFLKKLHPINENYE